MRNQRWQDVVTALAGIYVMATPFIIPYFFPQSAMPLFVVYCHLSVGVVLVMTGLVASLDKQLWEEWVSMGLAIIILISPWLAKFNGLTALTWNAVIAGAIVFLISGSVLFESGDLRRH